MRVLVNTVNTLSLTFYGDETPVSADGVVTVSIVDALGNAIVSGNATSGGSGLYTFVLPAQAQLSKLTATWSGVFSGNAQSMVSYVEVVGQRLFGLAELRASDPDLTTQNYPTTLLSTIRDEVEDEFQRICQRAFIPRYERQTLDGTGRSSQALRWPFVTKVRSVTVTQFGTTPTVYTTAQLAALSPTDYGSLEDTSGMIFFQGVRNVVTEYEYGWTNPPGDVHRAALLRARTRLTSTRTGVPDRATSFSAAEGGTFSLATAGRAGYQTGVPDVDAVLAQYSMRLPGIG